MNVPAFGLPSTSLWFRSGTNHPGEIRGTFDAGYQVGVSVSEIREAALQELAVQSEIEDGKERRLFVDSGAFGEVTFDPAVGRLVVKEEITDAEWNKRLDLYEEIAGQWGRRCFVVAPDRVGDQAETLARLARYSERCFWLCELGANVIVPLQRGELGIVEFALAAVKALGFNRPEIVWGLPCKKGATTPAELRELAQALAEVGHPWPRFHFLGLSPEPGIDPGEKFLAFLGAVRRDLPDCSVSCDSVRITALVGRTNGRGGGPRALTAARDAILAEGKLTDVAEVKAEAIRRVFGGEAKERADFVALMNSEWDRHFGPGLDPEPDGGVALPEEVETVGQMELPLQPVKVLSYGAGLDSFAMLVESVRRGMKPDVCAFLDVTDKEGIAPGEWPGTYQHIREVAIPFCRQHGIEFEWIDTTRYPVRDASSLWAWMWDRQQIPVAGDTRICTRIAKVERFERWVADRFPGQVVEVWIGFEAGEEKRTAKDPNQGKPSNWRRNRFPLQEWGFCRCRCEQVVRELGYPVPRKSACCFCLAGETEVVTRAGIRPIRELAGERHELLIPQVGRRGGLGHRGSFKEVEVKSFGVQQLWEVKLHRMKSKKTIRTTAEHRWFTVAGPQWSPASGFEVTTEELRRGDKLRTLRATPMAKEKLLPFGAAQGFTFGDGSRQKTRNGPASLRIYNQAKDGAMLRFFRGAEVAPVKPQSRNDAGLEVRGLPRFWKKPPPVDESRAFLLSWLAGYFAADGSVSEAGQAVLESADRSALQVARSIAAVCGVGYSAIGSRMREGFPGRKPSALHRFSLRLADLPSWFFLIKEHRSRVNVMRRSQVDQPWVVDSVRQLGIAEEVFCAVVPGTQAFGLAEDLMTGNCPYGSMSDWQTLARELPERFAEVVQLEARKPPTASGEKLAIMGHISRGKRADPDAPFVQKTLDQWVEGKARPRQTPCKVCGAAAKTTKATGCGYLAEAA